MRKELLDRRGVGMLAVGHMFNDVNQGAISALLPFLIVQHGLSYTAASGVVMASTAISGITQPLLGYCSDRHSMPWLIPLGILMGGCGIALSGIVPSYWLVVASVLLSGLGVAAFHPEGYRFANYLAGRQHAVGISVFTVGGNLGFALGPLLITLAVTAFGLAGTLAMAIPAAIYAILIWRELPRFVLFHPDNRKEKNAIPVGTTDWSAFARITAVIVLRAAMGFGLLAFIPLYLINMRSMPIARANSFLTILSVSVAAGTILSGYLTDKIGQKRLLIISLAVISPLIIVFARTGEMWGMISLVTMGVAMGINFTVAIVMGQQYAEANLGVASGITTGLAIGLGGMSSPILGQVADAYGLEMVMIVLAFFPLVSMGIAMTLPKIGRERAERL